MPASLVVGAQWGDEGKAKIIDYLSKDIDIIVRYQGGANAGHTVVVGERKFVFHLVPSGIIYPNTVCVIGNGVVLDTDYFMQECDELEKEGFNVYKQILISDSCHLILPHHKLIDAKRESSSSPGQKIGTTKRGIGICYADKMMRIGVRVGELLEPNWQSKICQALKERNADLDKVYEIEAVQESDVIPSLERFVSKMGHLIKNTGYYLNEELKKGRRVLLEGAQGTGLDVDFGTYPFVTSSNPTTGGALIGSGVGYKYLKDVIGISKAYITRVGEGPFPTEIHGEEGETLRKLGGEYGATTGRPRRCGWFDTEMLRHAVRVNGLDSIALTKIDILSQYDTIPVATGYELRGKKLDYFPSQGLEEVKPVYKEFPGWKEDISGITDKKKLPEKCANYISALQELMGVPISVLSTGPDRLHTISFGR